MKQNKVGEEFGSGTDARLCELSLGWEFYHFIYFDPPNFWSGRLRKSVKPVMPQDRNPSPKLVISAQIPLRLSVLIHLQHLRLDV
ncbi:MAG: hypothetical protein JWP34_4851 [Massilia sp.]|nr:hypothetical protein [Massilia sp.]